MFEEFNQKTGRKEFKVKIAPLPHRVRGLTNNIIKDLRDALDQATNAASFYVSGTYRRNRHFPFASSPDDFDVAVRKNTCKDIPTSLHSILKGYEPYPTGDGYSGGNNFLRMLGRISGPHKHRFTVITKVTKDDVKIGDLLGRPGEKFLTGGPIWFPANNNPNEITLVSIHPTGEVDFDYEVTMRITFAGSKMEGIPVKEFLRACYLSVSEIVQDLQSQALAMGPPGA